MINWQVTATKIYCDAVDEDVTIIVERDWNVVCTGYTKYVKNPDKKTTRMLEKKAERLGMNLGCEGPLDYRVSDYRDKLIAQEKNHPTDG